MRPNGGIFATQVASWGFGLKELPPTRKLGVARMGKLVTSGVGESWDNWGLELEFAFYFEPCGRPGIV